MKRFLSLLLCCMLLCPLALAEQAETLIGVWIETEGYGTLTLRLDGSATMVYYDGTTMDTTWSLTDDGYRFGDGMWYNSPLDLLDENTLSVSDGWMVFAREGFLPTTDEALLLGATPVGEEGEPFLGEWTLTSLVEGDQELDPALFGLTMTMLFDASGLVTIHDGLVPYTTTWFVAYGNIVLEGDILVLDENDQLVFTQPDGTMIFSRVLSAETDPANPADPVPVGEEGAAYLGIWTLVLIDADGMQMDPALFGMRMTLTFAEDGTVLYDDGLETDTMPWFVEDGAAIVDGMPLIINEEGQLVMDDGDATMIFAPGESSPAEELSDEELLLALMALMEQVSDEPAAFEPLNTKFVCDQYTVDTITLDGSTLGAEYSVCFYENNTADLTLGGILMASIPYAITEDGVYSINYYGMIYNCTPTDTGFDLDYFGTMTMHMVPAAE